MANLDLAEQVRAYLVTAGAVSAGESGTSTPPPCWFDPRDGAPEPPMGDDQNAAVVTLLTGLEIPGTMNEGFIQERVLEVRVRAKTRPRAELIQRQIRGLINEKKNTLMGALLVEQALLWRGVQPIASDETSWTLTQSFRVMFRITSLTTP